MESLVGKILSNRYQIVSSLGRGGMAEVFKAWDQQRAIYLALKMLRQDLAQDIIFLRRFQREAHTLKQLQHPNIVRFYGIEKDDINVFILMEYIDGPTLQSEIFRNNNQPMGLDFFRNVTSSLCSALHYAHQLGLVHCDIKPGNILINDTGHIQLTDFGIARMTDTATVTMVGFGTPAYMAPELVRGQNPSPQSDIYSLGIVLYEMVTGGERPFTGAQANVTGTMSEKVRWEQIHLTPPSPRRYNPEISSALEAVVLKCLMKAPIKRFSSALALLNAFEQATTPVKVTQKSAASQAEHPKTPIPLVDEVKEKSAGKSKPKISKNDSDKGKPSPASLKGENRAKVNTVPAWSYYLGGVILTIFLLLGIRIGFFNESKLPLAATKTPQTEVYVWIEEASHTPTDASTSILTATVSFTEIRTHTPSSTTTSIRTRTPTRTATRRTPATATNTLRPANTQPPPPANTQPPPPANTQPPPPPANTQPPRPTNTQLPTPIPTREPTPIPTREPTPDD